METPLLDALRTLATAATPSTLRRCLHLLIDDLAPDAPPPDMKTPANGGDHVAGEVSGEQTGKAAPVTAAKRTSRPASVAHPTRPNSSTANSPRMTPAEWLKFRERINAEMQRQGLDMQGLATATGYALATITTNMLKLSPPGSVTLQAKLQAFVDQAAAPAPHGNGATPAPPRPAEVAGNGAATFRDGEPAYPPLRAAG